MALKTPIYDSHVERGGRMVEFAGFHMPVTFEGIVAEHETVRNKVGLFDVSHMGEISITGPGAVGFADRAVTNSVAGLDEGQICYTVCCNGKGRVLDDLLVYRFSDERVLLVVNAVNVEKIFNHLKSIVPSGLEVRDLTPGIGQIAVQGPASRDLLVSDPLFSRVAAGIRELPYYRFFTFEHEGYEILLSRTGYTGELGYEIYLPAKMARGVWDRLLDGGSALGAAPIGLGARDTLRFEPGYCLYGHELDEDTSPLEAGLSWVVKLKKGDFIGREALAAEKEKGPARRLVGLEVTGKGIPRQGFTVHQGGETVGRVTSGTFSPTLNRPLAMALVKRSVPKEAEGITIDIRGRAAGAVQTPLPFYKGSVND
ncbi:MAG TPA: glycine cleavage system aminomethyltransferase GcvT [Candidatus Eisenbacteria bacterium]|uniref:Aminomethyltransferase n=1 Tax=Eiseniibacteriota bacterium TaxID=2212470 RepID=A0A7V2AVG9_UNCEI|nr:glycine cleavage system aminomethyltransferase GcvT [Candidatus Eisenbacteria bacterium]